MSFLDKLEKKIGKYAIKNLMLYVIIAYAVGYFLYISGNFSAVMALNLNPAENFTWSGLENIYILN